MSILDTLLNITSASAANKRAFEYTKALQQHQYDLNRQAIREYYTNNRYSLEQAGYNPLLAIPGSSAQGFSASASMSPVMPGSSGAGTDEINAISSALSAKEQRKVAKKEAESINQDVERKKLENKKLRNEINTSPRTVLSQFIENGHSPTFNSAISHLAGLKNRLGLGFIQPRNFYKTNLQRLKSFVSSVKSNHSAKSIPFEIRIEYNHNPSGKLGVWNSKRQYKGDILSDDEVEEYSRSRRKFRDKYPKPSDYFLR